MSSSAHTNVDQRPHTALLDAYYACEPDGRRELLREAHARYREALGARNELMRAALGEGWPVGWIADAMGLSRQRVSQFKNDWQRLVRYRTGSDAESGGTAARDAPMVAATTRRLLAKREEDDDEA